MSSSKDIIIWSGLCFLGLSAAAALYKERKSLLSRLNWITDNQEDQPTTDEITSPTKSDPDSVHACGSAENISDSDSFFSVTSECDFVGDHTDLTDSSSSGGYKDATKRSIVLKSEKRELETDAHSSIFTNTVKGFAEQLSSPIVASMEFQTPRRDLNDNGTAKRLDHIYNDVTPNQRVLEDTSPCTSQPTSYNRIYDGYHSIVTPNSPATMVFRSHDK
ncbi:uncharacterized protein LOC110446436 [Mizuhopecten yessoensis]|uniref:uncharacterized protein LOC110446436 n=1 Tax=Mizuhopecten yessoensis TaxID=6573 RepID=UPI000B458A75|nr:uncharacterized protein LOC110446436 [Mizuhopecten yessoensis]